MLARMHVEGDGVAKDEERARELARRSCEGSDGEGCALTATLFEKRDPKTAADAALSACSDSILVCAPGEHAALHRAELEFRQVPRDRARARALLERSCANPQDLWCAEAKRAKARIGL